MKISLSSIILFSSVASGLSLPLNSSRSVTFGSKDILTATGTSSSNEVSLRFEVPCDGCFVETDNRLLFDVAIRRAVRACHEGHILINGQEIEWADDVTHGAGTIRVPFVNGLETLERNATWKTSCIANEAQILSFQIRQAEHEDVKHGPGFTISFKQQDQPEVFRLVGEAIDISYPEDLADRWGQPVRLQRFTLASAALDSGPCPLEDEFAELETLKVRSQELQTLIGEKKRRIHQLLCDDFRTFCSTIKECDGPKCVLRVTMDKIPKYARLLSLYFQHRPSPAVTASSEKDPLAGESRKQEDATFQSDDVHPAQSSEFSPSPQRSAGYPATPDHGEKLSACVNDHRNAYSLPLPRYSLLTHIVPTALLLIIIGGIIFLTIRQFNLFCASPYRRAARLCSREERRNRRAYRRAAFKHAWQNWWNRYRRPSCTADYEEKRTLILEQEGVLEDAMQDEIRGLRVAHEIVGDMFRAEEGRSRLYHQANMPQYSRSGLIFPNASSTPPAPTVRPNVTHLPTRYRRSSSASSQSGNSLLPPQYEQELGDDIDVVDGFMYSSTFSSEHEHIHRLDGGEADGDADADDATPDSSVVDCSPRMSFDTGRTTLTTAGDRY